MEKFTLHANFICFDKEEGSMLEVRKTVCHQKPSSLFKSKPGDKKLVVFRSITDFVEYHYSVLEGSSKDELFVQRYCNPVNRMMMQIADKYPNTVFLLAPFHPLHVSEMIDCDPYGYHSWEKILGLLEGKFGKQQTILQLPITVGCSDPENSVLSVLNGKQLTSHGNSYLAVKALCENC